ncbi:MAG TPA: DUF2905 domain-containing protein [Thermomicrobiales bacterium]
MSDFSALGRFFIVVGALILLVGVILAFGNRIPLIGWLGKLPGDIIFRRGNTTIYIPIVSSILLSLLLTLIFNLIFRR